MKAITLQREIIKRGGNARIVNEHVTGAAGEWERSDLLGELNGYDIEMILTNGRTITGENDFYTVRRVSDRGYFDPGSDYNSGGYTFCHKIKDLDWAVRD